MLASLTVANLLTIYIFNQNFNIGIACYLFRNRCHIICLCFSFRDKSEGNVGMFRRLHLRERQIRKYLQISPEKHIRASGNARGARVDMGKPLVPSFNATYGARRVKRHLQRPRVAR